jgi:hypothetical protein
MIKRAIRKLLERCGIAMLPWEQFAEMTATQHRLAEEVDHLRRAERVLLDEVAGLKGTQRALTDELTSLRVVGSMRDAMYGGATLTDSSEKTDPAELQGRLISRLHASGIKLPPEEPVFIHVGFGHAGTTSLQLNFFSRRPDLFYLGTPYGEAGGLFSNLKYLDDFLLNEHQMLEWCRDVVYGDSRREGRPIVISDETFCDTSEIYYCPRHVPGDIIALRLKRYFPTAKIIFTMRNQLEYVSSMYFNLKRNYAFLAGASLPEFHEWWEGMHTQARCLYLQNIDYSQMIEVYSHLFGKDNVLILPLEELKTHGARRYLDRLCRFMNLDLRESDVTDFSIPRNERMTVVESRLAELVTAGSAEWSSVVRSLLEKESMAGLVANAPRLAIKYDDDQLREIRRVCVPGNQRLAAEFNLPLAEMGYLM